MASYLRHYLSTYRTWLLTSFFVIVSEAIYSYLLFFLAGGS